MIERWLSRLSRTQFTLLVGLSGLATSTLFFILTVGALERTEGPTAVAVIVAVLATAAAGAAILTRELIRRARR